MSTGRVMTDEICQFYTPHPGKASPKRRILRMSLIDRGARRKSPPLIKWMSLAGVTHLQNKVAGKDRLADVKVTARGCGQLVARHLFS